MTANNAFTIVIWVSVALLVLFVISAIYSLNKEKPAMVELELEEYVQLIKDRHNAGFYLCEQECRGTRMMDNIRCFKECQDDFTEVLSNKFNGQENNQLK